MSNAEPDDLEYHAMSWPDLDRLARGCGGSDVIRQLRQVERSRRLHCIDTLIEKVDASPDLQSPLPPLEDAWNLLLGTADACQEALEQILAHPYTGTWASYILRLLRDPRSGGDDLWFHAGHLHALAAAAAIRAGINFETTIPVWSSRYAVLPTLGIATVAAPAGRRVTTVVGTEKGIRVGEMVLPRNLAENTSDWTAIPCLVTPEINGLSLTIRLDSVDPYRGIGDPIPPAPVTPSDVSTWRQLLDDAWPLIVRHLPELADGFPVGFDTIAPQPPKPHKAYSASTAEAFGSATIALPQDGVALAVTLVHEFQHSRLNGLIHITELYEDDPTERFYTRWRDDPRPISGALQGVYAFFGMTAMWQALFAENPDNRQAAFELAYWLPAVRQTSRALLDDPMLTATGRRFVTEMDAALTPWLKESVPPDIAALADAAADDHYAGWRLNFLPPADDVVEALGKAWVSRVDGLIRQPADPIPASSPAGQWPGARTELVRLELAGHGRTALADPTTDVPGAIDADFAYLSGKLDEAARGYRAELDADPMNAHAWVGLGLVMAKRGPSGAANALLRCPELVRAVWWWITDETDSRPEPEEVAGWIAAATTWPSLRT